MSEAHCRVCEEACSAKSRPPYLNVGRTGTHCLCQDCGTFVGCSICLKPLSHPAIVPIEYREDLDVEQRILGEIKLIDIVNAYLLRLLKDKERCVYTDNPVDSVTLTKKNAAILGSQFRSPEVYHLIDNISSEKAISQYSEQLLGVMPALMVFSVTCSIG